jgi:4-amino-4-deoxy-L-arabinose transferase-like glycosyltransferase
MRRGPAIVAYALLFIAILRVIHMDRQLSQGFDESVHVGAGMEWIDKGTYTIDPVHPPLARYAVTLPLYLAGERFPKIDPDHPRETYNNAGNLILNDGGRYQHNLLLARLGILPFLCIGAFVLYWWTKKYLGDLAACVALGFMTTTPSILAYAGLAYNDLPVACLQLAFLCFLTLWLDDPNWRVTALLGVAGGLAIATKFTSIVFLTASAIAMFACKWWVEKWRGDRRSGVRPASQMRFAFVGRALAAAVIAVVLLWGTYGFSVGRVQEKMMLTPAAMPSFQHFPAIARSTVRGLILSDARVPAPELLRGLGNIWVANQAGPPAYLFGRSRAGGWWYFYPVAISLKTPVPLLILAIIGAVYVCGVALRRGHWPVLMPVASTLAIMAVAMAGRYSVGTRYILVVFALFSILAGAAAIFLWRLPKPIWGRILLCVLLLWQAAETIRSRHDFIAYFNELAPSDPSQALVVGCDLDCGQDLLRLADELHARGVSHLSLAVWTSADLSQMGLPPFDVLQPFQPVAGWIAISARSRRTGDVLHQSDPPEGFTWLNRHQPVAHIGQTMLLYHIPDSVSTR